MVLRLALLIIAGLWCGSVAAQEPPSCLECHPVHYAQQGSCVDCHRGDPRSSRSVIAHYGLIPAQYAHFTLPDSPLVERGRKRLDETACRRCHVIGDRGNRLATDLNQSVNLSDPLVLVEAIRDPVLFMPDFHFSDTLLVEVVNALYDAGVGREAPYTEVPRVVHFEDRGEQRDNVFLKNCGACHRVLTSALGGLGTGEVAPNLSGLLTPSYPPTYENEKSWNRDHLKKWLDNPRRSRKLARMPPVRLNDKDFGKLVDIFDEEVEVDMSPQVTIK